MFAILVDYIVAIGDGVENDSVPFIVVGARLL